MKLTLHALFLPLLGILFACMFFVSITPAVAATVNPNAEGVIFQHNFDNEPLHTYTDDDIRTTWNGKPMTKYGSVEIVEDPDPSGSHGRVMQVFFDADDANNPKHVGCAWDVDLGNHDELYFAYDLYFPSDGDFAPKGKLPGLASRNYKADAGTAPDGTDRWSGLTKFQDANGAVANYVYHANQPGLYGNIINWNEGPNGQVHWKRGAWNRVEVHYKMNTPGVLDGKLEAWFNGVKVADTNSIMYRMPGGEDLKIGTLRLKSVWGGDGPSKDEYIYFDNFVISKQPITHGPNATTPPPYSPGICNLYTPSVTTPTGYGASYNVFNQSELMISIYCNEDKSVTVTAGNNDDLTYVYNQGYYYANNQWNNFTYTCTDETIADIWCTKQATKTLTSTPTSGTTYLVSYTCQWRNNTWNCGCHNSACTTNHWQLQAFKL